MSILPLLHCQQQRLQQQLPHRCWRHLQRSHQKTRCSQEIHQLLLPLLRRHLRISLHHVGHHRRQCQHCFPRHSHLLPFHRMSCRWIFLHPLVKKRCRHHQSNLWGVPLTSHRHRHHQNYLLPYYHRYLQYLHRHCRPYLHLYYQLNLHRKHCPVLHHNRILLTHYVAMAQKLCGVNPYSFWLFLA